MLLAACAVAGPAHADVFDRVFTDVTTRAFAVVWVSDEAVNDASAKVFSDANGTTEITGSLAQTLVSQGFPPALANGVCKAQVTGLAEDTCVYVQTVTETASGTVLDPPAPPFPQVCTASQTEKSSPGAEMIANDLVTHDVLTPDGLSPGNGALLVLDVPSVGRAPLSAFVGEGFSSPRAVIDLGNLFDAAGSSAQLAGGETATLTEYRGLLCPGAVAQALVRYRRIPVHEETPPIPELEPVETCFAADTNCDDVVDIVDAQRVFNVFKVDLGQCRFHPDLDLVPDGVIDIRDAQSLLNHLFEMAPFGP